MTEKIMMTAGQVLDELRINPSTLRNWERRRVLIPIRAPHTQWRMFKRSDVDAVKDRVIKSRGPGRAMLTGLRP